MTSTVVPAAPTYGRLRLNRVGLWLFMASELMLFAGILATRFALLGTEVDEHVSQTIGLVITSILLASSYTAFRAEHAASHGDRAGTTRYLGLTLLLGAVFLGGVAIEWTEAFDAFPPGTEYGSIFFLMTGVHAFHVVTGLIFLGIVAGGARRGRYDEDPWPVEAGVKYWHFVDVVWVFFYPALYLI
ncbi:MAG: heme-copper oxidase subunit III [Acidimicrobiales bacterium]|nr:heme-copper oxidase subunit III [Acidimicrobiales bacterium]